MTMNLDLTHRELLMLREMSEEAILTAKRHGPLFERLMGRLCDTLAQAEWKRAGYPKGGSVATGKKGAKTLRAK